MYRIKHVLDLDDPLAVKAEEFLLDAYADDLFMEVILGGREELRRLTQKLCVRAAIIGGKFYVALAENNEVVGTAAWYPPGQDFLSDEKQQREGALEFFDTLKRVEPELFKWWTKTFLPINAEMSNKFLGKRFKINNWNLNTLAVEKEHRQKGIARRLVEVGEKQAEAQGLSTCFEAENDHNLLIYKRLGYKVMGSDTIPGPMNKPGCNFYTLVKYYENEGKDTQV